MKKILFFLLFIAISNIHFSQIATVDSILCGDITKERLLQCDSLRILGGTKDMKIISYEFKVGEFVMFWIKNDKNKFSDTIISTLNSLSLKYTTTLLFRNILATNKNNDTIKLPPIILYVVFPDKCVKTIYNYGTTKERATINGVFDGKMEKSKLMIAEEVKIENNKNNLILKQYFIDEWIIFLDGYCECYTTEKNILTEKVKRTIKQLMRGSIFIISKIEAENPKNNKIVTLNPIIITIE